MQRKLREVEGVSVKDSDTLFGILGDEDAGTGTKLEQANGTDVPLIE
jgi:hypothetical protein